MPTKPREILAIPVIAVLVRVIWVVVPQARDGRQYSYTV